MNNRLAKCKILLTGSTYKFSYEELFIVKTTDKVIFVKHSKIKKVHKKSIGVIKSKLVNTIHSKHPALGYYCVCQLKDLNDIKFDMRLTLENRLKDLELGITSLIDKLNSTDI